MFKSLLKVISQQPDDSIAKRLEKEPIVNKYWFNLGAAIVLPIATMLVGGLVLAKRSNLQPAEIGGYSQTKGTVTPLISLPYPHQSFKNVSGWLEDAIRASYAFSFSKIDQQIEDAEYYFTPTGYSMYLDALKLSHIREDVLSKRINIGVVPIQNPVLINSGSVGDTEFWRLRVPILTSYYAGKDPVIQSNMVEVLIIRVPAYKNPKGLAITEFNIVSL